jgi:hypothetical protein
MGGSTTSTTQSQQENQLPPWINTAAQQNYALAQNIATQPLQQYQGQEVAGVSPQMNQAWQTASTSGQPGASQYNAAQAGYLGVLGQTPQNVTAAQSALAAPTTAAQATAAPNTTAAQAGLSSLAGTNLSPYMNPYTSSVINATLPLMQQQLGLSQNQQQNAANAANAYGGSRQAVQQGVTQAQGALNMGEMAASLNQANFAQAQAAGEFDVGQANQMGQFNANQANVVGMNNQTLADQIAQSNAAQANAVGTYNQGQANQMGQFNATAQNQAALANQAAQQNQGQLNLAAAGGLGSLGNAAQQAQLQNYGEQLSAGSMEQQQAQNQINADIANYQQAWQYPYTQLGVLQSALGMTPYETATQGQSTTQTQSSPNLMQAATSGLQMLGGLFNPSQGLMSSLSGAAGGLSDRRMKTDIAKVGDHPAGVGIYSYRYKGDPKSYPKVVGPMAEDVMKIAPHAVATIPGSGGKKAVHMGALNALAPPRRGLMFGPRGGAGPIGAGAPLIGRGVGAMLGQGMGPPMPGPLSAPGVAGAIGALGAPMRGRPPRIRGVRPPPIRGALGG